MKVLKYPIILIVLFLGAGILADYHLKPPPALVFALGIAAVIAFLSSYYYSQKALLQKAHFLITTCLLSLSIGVVSHWLHFEPNQPAHYTHLLEESGTPVIQGVVAERLKPDDYSNKYYFRIYSVNNQAATGQLLLSVPKGAAATSLHPGDKLFIADTPQPINKPLNPYQFDYAVYMARQNIFHQLKLKDNYIFAGKEQNFNYYIAKLRNSLISSFDIHEYTSEVKSTINALVLGQRQDMDKQITDDYTNAGVVHILAISGLHFATLFYIVNLLLKPLRRFSARGYLMQLILVLAVLWIFALITGLSASVVRSVVMFSFIGVGKYLNRNSNIFNSIAASMLVLLIAKPNFIFDVGFQLSYAAVLAIVWLQPLYSRIRTSKYKAVNYLTDTVVISLVAQIGVLPLSLYYFNQFPLLFLVANIIVIPLSTAILLVGLLVIVLNYTLPALAIVSGKLLSLLIEAMNSFIGWIASFENLVLRDIPFTLVLNISLYTVLILSVRWLYEKSYRRTVAFLSSVIILQLIYTITSINIKVGDELVLFNNRHSSLLTIRGNKLLTVYSNDSLAREHKAVKAYNKENFNEPVVVKPLRNTIWFKSEKILVIDSTGIYPANSNPDMLLLTQSPKVNLERILKELKPKKVVADATNYKTYIARWEATCYRSGIPFHATSKRGFFRLNK